MSVRINNIAVKIGVPELLTFPLGFCKKPWDLWKKGSTLHTIDRAVVLYPLGSIAKVLHRAAPECWRRTLRILSKKKTQKNPKKTQKIKGNRGGWTEQKLFE